MPEFAGLGAMSVCLVKLDNWQLERCGDAMIGDMLGEQTVLSSRVRMGSSAYTP